MLIKEVTATPIDYLRTAVGRDDAAFRDEQLECIEAAVRGERLLVVQRTGWGKSIVYFIATRLLRDRGAGATLIVSPLLSLMRNQLAAAARIGLRSATINSANTEDWDAVIRAMRRNEIDVLLISPERLANDAFRQNVLVPIGGNVGLFVIDEAHCISDWGHDFRPDYRRISQLFKLLPPSLPVLATTATANNRVVDDVVAQLGNVSISRGPLVRKSLRLQNILLPDQASRLAWLAQYLPTLPGSGIVYTLTVRDAERVAAFLRLRGIDAVAYHADSADREMLEARLLRNDLKVLVATVALGMGFDKPDLGFVVHFQRPGSVVHYYQQIGRAGRAVDEAFGILLGGAEDDEIIDFFIRQAFPPEGDVLDVLEALNCADDGLSVAQIESFVNLPFSRIERTLKLLATETPAPIRKEGSKWYRSPVPYVFNVGKVQQLTTIRRREQQRMQEYMRSSDCLMQFLAAELDDPFAAPCGKCANCAGRVVPVEVPIEGVIAANEFLQRTRVTIEPRKLWPVAAMVKDGFKGKIAPFQNEPGRALALWEDGGWAELRGTDMIATAAALNEGGRVIAILPEGLGRPSVISRYRDAIVDGRLLLLSSVYPDAGFTIGNAMGRNKVIYGIAESAVIVRADANTGGTWAGAEAELKREDAIPVFVRAEGDLADGNRALIALGAHEFPPQPWSDLRALLTTSRMSANVGEKPTPGQRSLFEHRTDRATTRM